MRKFLSKGRGVLLALLVIVCAFLLNSFSSIDIEKTAIIVAVGIDYETETSEYVLTGQLAMPLASGGGEAPAQTPTMITGRGPTPAGAYHDIAAISGWSPTLSFCTVIVLGEELLSKPLMDVMDFALRTKELNDSCLLSVYQGTAIDFFNQRTPLDQLTTFSALKIFAKENTLSSGVAPMSVKNFAMNFFRQGNGNFLPYITAVEDVNKENKSEEDNSKSKLVDLEINRIVAMNQDKSVEILTPELSKPLVLLTLPVNIDTLNLSDIKTADYHAKNLELQTESKPGKISAKFNGDKIECEIKYETTVKILHLEAAEKSIKTIVDGHVPDEIKAAAKEKLEAEITAFVNKIQELDCDLLQLEEMLYKSQPKQYRSFREKYGEHQVLKNTSFKVEVTAKARD